MPLARYGFDVFLGCVRILGFLIFLARIHVGHDLASSDRLGYLAKALVVVLIASFFLHLKFCTCKGLLLESSRGLFHGTRIRQEALALYLRSLDQLSIHRGQ